MSEFIIESCTDLEFIDQVVDELQFDTMVDGMTQVTPAATMVGLPGFRFFAVREGNSPRLGLILLVGEEIHTMFLSELRGMRAVEAMKEFIRWVWENTDTQVLRSYFFSHRPDVKWFTRKLGALPGETVEGFTVGGRPVTKHMVYLPRPLS